MYEDMVQAGRTHVYEIGPVFGKVEVGNETDAFCDLSTTLSPGVERRSIAGTGTLLSSALANSAIGLMS